MTKDNNRNTTSGISAISSALEDAVYVLDQGAEKAVATGSDIDGTIGIIDTPVLETAIATGSQEDDSAVTKSLEATLATGCDPGQ